MSLGTIIASDTHVHSYSDFATVLDNGLNSRLYHCLSALEQALDRAHQQDYPFLFCGDLIHSRTLIDARVMVELTNLFRKWTKKGVEIVMIPGNHDLYSKTGDRTTALKVFASIKGVHVFDKYIYRAHNGLNVLCCGYGVPMFKSEELLSTRLERQPAILLGHDFVAGTKTGDGYMFESGIAVKELKRMYKVCRGFFFGHIHTFQEVEEGRIYVPGATLQRYFADAGEPRGFLEVQVRKDGVEVEHIKPEGVPEFIVLDYDDLNRVKLRKDNAYYRVLATSKNQLRKIDQKMKGCVYTIDQDFAEQAKSVARLDIKKEELTKVSDKEMVRKFVKTVKPDKQLDRERLIKCGCGYL